MAARKTRLIIKVLTLFCWILLLVLVAVDSYAEPIETRIVTARGGLNVRRAPSTNSPIIYTLDETAVVVIDDWQDGWALVCHNAPPYMPIGWACGDWLK